MPGLEAGRPDIAKTKANRYPLLHSINLLATLGFPSEKAWKLTSVTSQEHIPVELKRYFIVLPVRTRSFPSCQQSLFAMSLTPVHGLHPDAHQLSLRNDTIVQGETDCLSSSWPAQIFYQLVRRGCASESLRQRHVSSGAAPPLCRLRLRVDQYQRRRK